jgi:hypothetical protein
METRKYEHKLFCEYSPMETLWYRVCSLESHESAETTHVFAPGRADTGLWVGCVRSDAFSTPCKAEEFHAGQGSSSCRMGRGRFCGGSRGRSCGKCRRGGSPVSAGL